MACSSANVAFFTSNEVLNEGLDEISFTSINNFYQDYKRHEV
jgi:hypothetical protein